MVVAILGWGWFTAGLQLETKKVCSFLSKVFFVMETYLEYYTDDGLLTQNRCQRERGK